MKDERTIRERRIQAWLAFLRVHARVTATLEGELEESEGLPMVWFDVLNQLRQSPGKQLRMQDLVGMLAMTASGLSRRITRMEQAGLVERRPCPDDRRGVLVVLTREGERRYRRALPVHLRGVERHFLDHVSDDEAAVLETVFCQILTSLEGAEPLD